MKYIIKMPLKFTIIMIVIWASIILCVIAWLTNNYSRYKDNLEFWVKKEVKGTITVLKDEKRDSYFIEIDDLNVKHQMHSLKIGWAVRKYNIAVGDSVSKGANSRKMAFYKLKNGVFEVLCEYEVKE
jgi:hypothetical protein